MQVTRKQFVRILEIVDGKGNRFDKANQICDIIEGGSLEYSGELQRMPATCGGGAGGSTITLCGTHGTTGDVKATDALEDLQNRFMNTSQGL